MNKKRKVVFSIVITVVLMFYTMSLLFTGVDTRNIFDNINPVRLYEKIAQARKFIYTKQTIVNEFVDEIDEEALLDNVYKEMLGALDDPYSYYYTRQELTRYRMSREGSFGGIGVSVRNDYDNLIIEVIELIGDTSPAKLAGIKTGDRIISADGKGFDDRESMAAMFEIIPGEVDTTVVIGVYRPDADQTLEFEIVRKKIFRNNTSKEMIGDIGYIRIESFTLGVSDDFQDALDFVMEEGATGIIVDVRANGGGSLDEVIEVSEMFLSGSMIVYIEDKYGDRKEYFADLKSNALPITVLIDQNSASASELFAGAIQANNRGNIIGETSFGKGIVQTDYYLDDGTGFKITTKKYYLPNGQSIHGLGIIPDIVVEQDERFKGYNPGSIPRDEDPVIEAAILSLR